MDFICKYGGCENLALWQCECIGKLRFCEIHILPHSREKECKNKYIKKLYQKIQVNKRLNALNDLASENSNLSYFLSETICNFLTINLKTIEDKKTQIIQHLELSQNDEADYIVSWAKAINLKSRDKDEIVDLISNLFALNDNYEKQKNKIQELEAIIEEYTGKYGKANEEILELESIIKSLNKTLEEKDEKIESLKEKKSQSKKDSFEVNETHDKKIQESKEFTSLENVKINLIAKSEGLKQEMINLQQKPYFPKKYTESQTTKDLKQLNPDDVKSNIKARNVRDNVFRTKNYFFEEQQFY